MKPDLELVAGALGTHPLNIEPAGGGGYTRSASWRVATADGTAFVKQAEDEGSLTMLRREALAYEGVEGAFMPAFVGFTDAGNRAVLAVEYIGDALWPPPYPEDISPLFAALDDVAGTRPPASLPRVADWPPRWTTIAADPRPLLGLGVCSPAWLAGAIEQLMAAEAEAVWTGDALVHNDVYSGNMCFQAGRALLVDWGVAAVGSRWTDVAFALLGLRSEAGRVPDLHLPRAGSYASALASHFATDAPKPLPAWADPSSTLREDMTQDLRAALAWAAEELDLPPLT